MATDSDKETTASFDGESLEAHGVSPLDERSTRLLDLLHPKEWIDPEPKTSYNLVVIGSGAGSLI